MDYDIQNDGGNATVALKGRLTFADHESFRDIVDVFKDGGVKECSLDLSGLEFIDSAGLGLLLIVRDSAQEASASVSISGAQGAVKKMLEIAKFGEIIPIAD